MSALKKFSGVEFPLPRWPDEILQRKDLTHPGETWHFFRIGLLHSCRVAVIILRHMELPESVRLSRLAELIATRHLLWNHALCNCRWVKPNEHQHKAKKPLPPILRQGNRGRPLATQYINTYTVWEGYKLRLHCEVRLPYIPLILF